MDNARGKSPILRPDVDRDHVFDGNPIYKTGRHRELETVFYEERVGGKLDPVVPANGAFGILEVDREAGIGTLDHQVESSTQAQSLGAER
jgi:hypothetical protein